MELDSKTIEWARKRCSDLLSAEVNIGNAIDKADELVNFITEAAYQVFNQPESEVFVAFASDIRAIANEMKERRKLIIEERLETGKDIVDYQSRLKEGDSDDSGC